MFKALLSHRSDKPLTPEPTVRELHIYGFAATSNYMVGGIAGVLALPILNIVLGISPTAISTILLARGLVDAFTDPMMAYISDRHKGPYGRRRPFILVGGILLGILTLATYWLPRDLGDVGTLLWFGTGTILSSLAWTIFAVPHYALGIELSPSYHGRTRVAVYRSIWEKVSGLAVPWYYPFCMVGIWGDPIIGLRVLMIMVVTITVPGAILCASRTVERSGWSGETRFNFVQAVLQTLANRHFRRLTYIFVLLLFAFGLIENFGIYLTTYYVMEGANYKQAGAYFSGIMATLGFAMGMLSLPFISFLSRRYQKHKTLVISLWLMIIGSVLHLFLMRPGQPWLMLGLPVFYAFGISCIFTILPSMQADIVDMDELKTGERREGMFGAAASLLMKSAGAIGVGISGPLIDLIGFEARRGQDQAEGVMETMLWLNSVGQAALVSCCLFFLYKYPLTEAVVNATREKLEARRGGVLDHVEESKRIENEGGGEAGPSSDNHHSF